jgi:hypothetical protein
VDDSTAPPAVSVYTNVITTLPQGYRPTKTVYRLVPRESLNDIQLIKIQSTGDVNAAQAYTLDAGLNEINPDTTKAVYLDGISFYAKQIIKGAGGGSKGGSGTGDGASGGGAST